MTTVHLLDSDPTFTPQGGSLKTIVDAQTASIDQGGNENEYMSAGSPNVSLIAMDKIKDKVSVNVLQFPNGANVLNVGDKGSLTCVLKARADGKGTTGSGITKTWPYAVVTGITGGPTIEGSPSYSVNFSCTPLTNT